MSLRRCGLPSLSARCWSSLWPACLQARSETDQQGTAERTSLSRGLEMLGLPATGRTRFVTLIALRFVHAALDEIEAPLKRRKKMEYQLEFYRPGSCDEDACIRVFTSAAPFLPIHVGDLLNTPSWGKDASEC